MFLTAVLPFLMLAAFGVVLWIFAAPIAAYLLPGREEDSEPNFMADTQEIYTVAFTIAGVIILALAIPGVFQVISNIVLLKTRAAFTDQTVLKLQTTYTVMEKIVQLAIRFGLILGSRGLSRLLCKIREF